MKRILGIFAVLAVLAGAGYFGWQFWQKQQLAKQQETAASPPAESPPPSTPAAAPAPETAAAGYDLTAQPDGMSKAVATLTMENGDSIRFRFFPNEAPNTVKRIAQLIQQGFYTGIVVHRVEPGFVVQAGDPTGTGAGGSGVKLKAEFNQHRHEPGVLSMARTSDPDSADSQFFIMIGAAPHLDGKYTAFGKAIEGYENALKIKVGDKIKSFTIQ